MKHLFPIILLNFIAFGAYANNESETSPLLEQNASTAASCKFSVTSENLHPIPAEVFDGIVAGMKSKGYTEVSSDTDEGLKLYLRAETDLVNHENKVLGNYRAKISYKVRDQDNYVIARGFEYLSNRTYLKVARRKLEKRMHLLTDLVLRNMRNCR